MIVVLFDEIAETSRRMAAKRLADALDIPLEVLPSSEECARAQEAHDENVSKFTVQALGIMIAQYRETYRLREDAPLVISLGRDVVEILERRGRLLGGDGGAKRYVMVGKVKVEVEEDNWGRDFVTGFNAGVREGVKRKAPTTGPRGDAFARRGKGEKK